MAMKTRAPPLTALMTLFRYQGQAVAIADVVRFHLAQDVDRLPHGHPLKTFVCLLTVYARDVLTAGCPTIHGASGPPTASATPARR
jgi:hypothetical protein